MAGVICAESWRKGPRVSARNRVKAAATERVATQDTPNCKRRAIENPVPAYRRHAIFRTCGLKTARTRRSANGMEQRRDPAPVEISHLFASTRLRRPFAEPFEQWQRSRTLP